MKRFEVHSHTHYSNLRLLDCINRPKDLVNKAIDIGLQGIAITDHDCLSSHIEMNMYAQQIISDYPYFKLALGNEIYLTEDRTPGQKYYHFILIAKNKNGHRALRELSSKAWLNSFYDRGMERVATLYDDLKEAVRKYPNSLIATTACLGGELSTLTCELIRAEKLKDELTKEEAHTKIVNFILMCKELFGNDFYIECAPGCSKDQIAVNQRLISIAQCFDVKMVIGTDAHYLTKDDRFVHKSYLNSKGGEREVDDFYEYSYLQEEDEIRENLKASNYDDLFIDKLFSNSMEIWDKIENYSLLHKQTIPKVDVMDYRRGNRVGSDEYPILKDMLWSTDKVERYWVNECINKLEQLDKCNHTYLSRLEEEADIKRTIGEKLETNMFAYDCVSPIAPKAADGELHKCTKDDIDLLVDFFDRFHNSVGIDKLSHEEYRCKAENLVKDEALYLWKNSDGIFTSSCSLNFVQDMATISLVFTRDEFRRKHYAENLVYQVTEIARDKGFVPMLYTDADYAASNACYEKIGYILKGKLCTIG